MKEKQIAANVVVPEGIAADRTYGGREARAVGSVLTFKLDAENRFITKKELMVTVYTKKDWKAYVESHRNDALRIAKKEITVKPLKVEGVDMVEVTRPYASFELEDDSTIAVNALCGLQSYKRFRKDFLDADEEGDVEIEVNPEDFLLCNGTLQQVAKKLADYFNAQSDAESPTLEVRQRIRIPKAKLPTGFTSDVTFALFA